MVWHSKHGDTITEKQDGLGEHTLWRYVSKTSRLDETTTENHVEIPEITDVNRIIDATVLVLKLDLEAASLASSILVALGFSIENVTGRFCIS